jgi:hypothetical protein
MAAKTAVQDLSTALISALKPHSQTNANARIGIAAARLKLIIYVMPIKGTP